MSAARRTCPGAADPARVRRRPELAPGAQNAAARQLAGGAAAHDDACRPPVPVPGGIRDMEHAVSSGRSDAMRAWKCREASGRCLT